MLSKLCAYRIQLTLALGLITLVVVTVARLVWADSARCANQCYIDKSRAYQECRAIPPADRNARQTCFHQADRDLARCLERCR